MFKDLNFKLSVISSLMKDGHYVKEAEALQDKYADTAEDYEQIKKVMEFYKSLKIPSNLLETITTLRPDGGDLAYTYATTVWDGEDEQFDISSIEGIEHLTNLETFDPISMISVKGIDYTPILGCKKLKKVDMSDAKKDKKNEDVKEELKKRGVEVE